jgi:polyphosphate kinase 2 (PPK2 family)
MFEVESIERWPQVRRLSETQVAIRTSTEAPWVVVEAASALSVRFAPLLDVPEEAEWLE